MTDPLIAIVGRPNVGKSTLFNRLVGGRPALVHDTPHLTRDRRYGEVDYFGVSLRVVDTGGLDPEAQRDVIGAGIHRQAERAIGEADALVLVVDGPAGISAIDHQLAARLRETGKPVFLAVNKIDHPTRDGMVHDFHELGIGSPFAVSAAHGRGVDALLEAITLAVAPEADTDTIAEEHGSDLLDALDNSLNAVPDEGAPGDDDGDDEDMETLAEEGPVAPVGPLRVAFVGRPNAGKSSLTNRLLGEERSLVHHEAGTTTDPVDTPFSLGGRDYLLVDTAGIRRKAKVDADVERIAVSMALSQIQRANVVVLVIDASIGPAEQDARIAGMVEEAGRALVLALNKSDLVIGEAARAALKEQTADNFHFLTWAPTVNLSAQRGDGVDRLLDVVNKVASEHCKRIQTSQLNRFFAEVIEHTPPPLHHGHATRIHYLTQAATRPPTFILWANKIDGLSPSYRRFLANKLRERYGFKGSPIRIIVKARKDRHDQK